MESYRILKTERCITRFHDLYLTTSKLKHMAPHIDWIVIEEDIFDKDDTITSQLCLKVPKAQYEASSYLYALLHGYSEGRSVDFSILHKLQDQLDHLAHLCSFPVKDEEFGKRLDVLVTVLADIYGLGTQLPQGINLHLFEEQDEPYEHFPDIWIVNEDLFREDMEVIRENLSFILYETSKFYPLETEEDYPLEAGIVFETYQSFHSLNGWGMRLLDTLKIIHKVQSKYKINGQRIKNKKVNNKKAAEVWIKDLVSSYHLFADANKDFEENASKLFSFPIIGFADEPEVFIQSTSEGIKVGYQIIRWMGPHYPTPALEVKHVLAWDSLERLALEDKESKLLEILLKTIDTRKRQYKTCQFCGCKIAPEHRFDKDTCHTCASEQFGVVY
ncbi:hypothetical protein D0469_01080 [Peribacillus saganii]|uniref:Uncharacterized protein n=1 Tax=Peribacillus saganii TaxID=2303992 RepID=A0A372LTF0_9BACI|nr:hypothetical protein [Peribacillus saganii]RFU71463.1 hypothetical protein D0469_01080 [Peribacillus saganii]